MKLKETSPSNAKLLVLQKSLPLILIPVVFLALIFCNPKQWRPLLLLNLTTSQISNNRLGTVAEEVEDCDIFTGEWAPNPDAPYYTNSTCSAIHEQQNCMKYGRTDTEFMNWRWKPYGCELPLFNPSEFLERVRGKSMAFVGDSLGRNQMESLLCLLSQVEQPFHDQRPGDEGVHRWKYMAYNFTVAMFWSPHLVRADTNGPIHTTVFNLYLDEVDATWMDQIDEFDYVILSGGHWFLGPMVFYENRKIIGCQYCQMKNVTNLTTLYGFRKAFSTVFRALNNRRNYRGVTYLRTYSPAHYEGGAWNQGGDCVRARPFKANETTLAYEDQQHYLIQIEEFRKAEAVGRNRGKRYKLIDITHAMLLRPDGHPRKYGHWVHQNATLHNDCLHWCLPGPVDSWSDLLQYVLLKQEIKSTTRD